MENRNIGRQRGDSPEAAGLTAGQTNKPNSNSRLRVCTLSGTNEVGRNCSFIEYGDDIVVVDIGLMLPGNELLGIDYLIPNYNYLKENKHKIRGVVLTHGHIDHTGALGYILPEIGFPPVYGGRFGNKFALEKITEFGLQDKVKFNDVYRNTEIQLGSMKATFIGITHSIPNAFSIFFETPGGNVFFSGDYKIDEKPVNEPESDYDKLETLRGKVDLALVESTYAGRQGRALFEQDIHETLEEIISKTDRRIIFAAFSTLVSRTYSVLNIAQKTGRKVFVSGRSMHTIIRIAREIDYIRIPDNVLVDESHVAKYPPNQVLFLCTGAQGEEYGALNRISKGEHKYFKAKKNDLLIMSSSEIPTNVTQIERMTDRLIEQGVDIIQKDTADVHASGHGMSDDYKILFDLIQPKTILPIHGSLTARYKNKSNFLRWGMKDEQILLTKDGQCWEFLGDRWEKGGTVDAKPIMIDGLGVGDIGEVVLKDREQLSEFGMVVVALNLDPQNGRMNGRPRFVSRGFVYVKASQHLFEHMEKLVKEAHQEWVSGTEDEKGLKIAIEKSLAKYIFKVTERKPMVLVMVV